jgi:hypothetical protein
MNVERRSLSSPAVVPHLVRGGPTTHVVDRWVVVGPARTTASKGEPVDLDAGLEWRLAPVTLRR